MFSVSPRDQQRQHHADQRQRQREQDRQRIEERAELHHEDQVHQQHRDAERGEDACRTPRSGSPTSPPWRDAYARRQPQPGDPPVDVARHVARASAPATLASTVTTWSRSRWSICAGPTLRRDGAPPARAGRTARRRLPLRAAAAARRRHQQRQLLEIGRAFARASGARRTCTSRVLPERIDPVARRRRRRRRGAATARPAPTVTPSVPARPRLSSTSSSGFWPARREADVHRARHLAHLALRSPARQLLSVADVLAPELQLDLLLAAAEAAAATGRPSRRRPLRAPARICRASSCWQTSRSFFGTSLHVDAAGVDVRPSRSCCRAWCRCTRPPGGARAMRAELLAP